jgi:glucokinase
MTVIVGLELGSAAVAALVVDEEGRVAASARERVGRGGLVATARELVTRVAGGGVPAAVGVAAEVPEAPAVVAAVSALSTTFAGVGLHGGAVPSGAAAAVAEAWIGAGKGTADLVYFSAAGHPVAGIVRNGVPIVGARRRAASVSWLALNPVEREDYRKSGCLDAEVSAAGIVRRLIWRIKAGDHSRIEDQVAGSLGAITPDHVLAAARDGDGVAVSVVRDTAKYLGMAAANLVSIVDPEVLVLGGVMASAADLLLEPVRGELARRVPTATMDALRVELAVLGAEAAAIGAARLASVAMQ